MPDENAGTTLVGDEAPVQPGTPAAQDEVTTLRSRNAGLDAKVTELTKAQKAAEDRAAEAARKLADYEAGRVGADEALRAQLAAKEQEIEATRREAQVSRIAAKFPETFALFGEAVAGMAEETLAASEVRLTGAGQAQESPTPVGANPQRREGGQKAIEDMSIAELKAHLRRFPPSVMGIID